MCTCVCVYLRWLAKLTPLAKRLSQNVCVTNHDGGGGKKTVSGLTHLHIKEMLKHTSAGKIGFELVLFSD